MRRRELDYHRWKKNGAMINVGNPVDAGQIVPARIVAVWGDTPESAVQPGARDATSAWAASDCATIARDIAQFKTCTSRAWGSRHTRKPATSGLVAELRTPPSELERGQRGSGGLAAIFVANAAHLLTDTPS